MNFRAERTSRKRYGGHTYPNRTASPGAPGGIPTIRDRVVQMSAVLVLTPIFEADMPDEQYAYRKNRGALDAVQAVHKLLCRGYP